MPEVESGSNEPFIIYHDKTGEWHCDFMQNQYGQKSAWVEDVKDKDPFAVEFTGEDFSKGSFPYVYDKVLAARFRAEYDADLPGEATRGELGALADFLENNMGEFSSEITDYIARYDRPLASINKMIGFSLEIDTPHG